MPRDPRRPVRRVPRPPPRRAAVLAVPALVAVMGAELECGRPARRAPPGTRFGFSLGELSSSTRGGGPQVVDVSFGDAPAPAGARERLRALAPAGLRVVLTRWAPVELRPGEYPAGLPFLAGREAQTAEHVPDWLTRVADYADARGRDAAWHSATRAGCDSVIARLVAASAADDWQRDAGAASAGSDERGRFARAGWTRTLRVRPADPLPPPIRDAASGQRCTAAVADRPATGGEGWLLPWHSWPHWWDPGFRGPPPPPEPSR